MNILIQSKNIKLSLKQKKFITHKVEKLSKLSEKLKDSSCSFKVEINHLKVKNPDESYSCQLTINAPKAVLRAETKNQKIESALETCLQKIKKPIQRYKIKINRQNKITKSPEAIPMNTNEDFVIPKILKRKRFSDSNRITEDEAIDHMEMVGHSFYLFNNLDTNRFSVVYKRTDGFYGIVEPNQPS